TDLFVELVPSDSIPRNCFSVAEASPSSAIISNKRRKTVRKYDSSYLQFGFSWSGTEEEPRPQCVVCGDVLSNESMKPAHLRRHLLTRHPGLKDKPLDFFIRKCDALEQSKSTIQTCSTSVAKAQDASYRASLRIVKAGKPHTIGEQLCLPLKTAKQLDLVPLSNDTVSRRIKNMSEDVKNTLIERIKGSRYYAIQLDETTDVADLANLLVYVRYECDSAAQEDFLFCQSLETRTTAEHIFQLLDAFVKENGLDWSKCVGVCTDGARAMTGHHSGVAARVREVAAQMRWTHCSIHREALAAKKIPDNLKSVLDSEVKTVNFIKARPMHSRLFHVLCDEMGSEHVQLLLHTEVRWLSRGKVLSWLFELHREVQMFLQDKNFPLSDVFEDTVWLSQLAYLADIFSPSPSRSCPQPCRMPVLNKGSSRRRFSLVLLLTLKSVQIVKGYSHTILHAQLLNRTREKKKKKKKHPLLDFWIQQHSQNPALSDKAVRFLLPFTTKYLCKKGFFALAAIKTKYRSRMDAEPDRRLKLTSVEPDIAGLCAQKQGHPSH
uniref:C2H2-type domain-containing protein n=1 Tax=Salarias fasciatus TaxID=181472 RepID=A0A672FBK0_SALFA